MLSLIFITYSIHVFDYVFYTAYKASLKIIKVFFIGKCKSILFTVKLT